MKITSAIVCGILLLVGSKSYSQNRNTPNTLSHLADNWHCSAMKNGRSVAKVTVGSRDEDSYDMKYLKFNLTMTNLSTAVSGDVTLLAKVVAPMPRYVFELDSVLTVDSVFVNGIPHPITTLGSVRTVTLPAPLLANTMFTTQVYYHGTSPDTNAFFNGITSGPTYWGGTATYTLSEPYNAKAWWPCKQSLRDKIDSVDMWITVEDSLKAGSNGILQAVTPIGTHMARYEWKERYPIDFYLISATVASYNDYSYYMHFTGSTDSMLVQNYVYQDPFFMTYYKTTIDSTGMMIDYFSNLYGRYPFWKEKYGHCTAPLGGGEEHQTMTTIGYYVSWIVAHELGHQWFGDNVTCGSWADIMMNEGFASYTEDLFMEHFNSHTMAVNDLRSKQHDVRTSDTGVIFVDDTTTEERIFDDRLTYNKGACVLNMLRFVFNNDTEFFNVYRTYQAQHSRGNGTIMDFKNTAEGLYTNTVNGVNLDTFFNQWTYLQGFPIYTVMWNQEGSNVYVQLDQQTSDPSSVAYFSVPVEIKLFSSAGDTIIRVNNTQASQLYHFNWGKSMTTVSLDPNSWLVDSVRKVIHDTALNVTTAMRANHPSVRIYPNPASEGWTVENLPANSALSLTDISGRQLWQENEEQRTTAIIPAGKLAAGMYLLKVTGNDDGVSTYKLLKN